MSDPLMTITATALLLAMVYLAVHGGSANRSRERARRCYFDTCAGWLDQCHFERRASGFSRLSGTYRGNVIDLQAVPDTLTFRKLPALWVLVTLPGPVPAHARLNLMLRPTGQEPFSTFGRLPHDLAVPAGFPPDCAMRTDDPKAVIPAELLRPHLALFDDASVKELVISPNGLRVVLLAEEADRARYLVYRDAEMGRTPLAPERIEGVVGRLVALRLDLKTRYSDSLQGKAA